jgi:hypothetical protein
MFSLIKRHITIFIFVASLCFFSFGYGVLVGAFEFFPYEFLNSAHDAYTALKEKHELYSDKVWLRKSTYPSGGVSIWDQNRAFNGLTFLTLFKAKHFTASLIDMNGNALHSWDIPYSKVWPKAQHVIFQAPDGAIDIHGAHLYPNGDVILSFDAGNYPYGGGLVKIDKDSKVLWSISENTHHDVNLDDDGNIWACAHYLHSSRDERFPLLNPPFYEDYILCSSPSGKVIKRISMLEAIYRSGREGILFANGGNELYPGKGDYADRLHLNNVEVLGRGLAGKFPEFNVGDILVSFRNLDTIAVIDPDRQKIKWSLTGLFLRQHDPDFLPDGDIMVFDNRKDDNGGRVFGGSRIVEINPLTQKVVWSYKGTKDRPFFSYVRGKQSVLPNGNVLIADSEMGRVFEVTHDKEKRIVWEYVNKVKDGYVGVITQADRRPREWYTFLPN